MRYYHVAGDTYMAGDDLCSIGTQVERGYALPANKWIDDNDGDWPDTDIVCMFDCLNDAREFAKTYGGTILVIDIPDNEHIIASDRNAEGYHYAYHIPARCICALGST